MMSEIMKNLAKNPNSSVNDGKCALCNIPKVIL